MAAEQYKAVYSVYPLGIIDRLTYAHAIESLRVRVGVVHGRLRHRLIIASERGGINVSFPVAADGGNAWGSGRERPEHDDRNPIKGISIVMLA